MNNRDFVIQVLKVKNPEIIERCLSAMGKYGDNKWWELDTDPRKFAYYQIHEKVMLGTFVQFGESLMLLLDRYVEPEELVGNALKEEAKRAWTYQVESKQA